MLYGNVAGIHSQHTQGVHLNGQRKAVGTADHRHGKLLTGMGPEHLLGVLQIRGRNPGHRHNMVSPSEAGAHVGRGVHHAVNHKRQRYIKHTGRIDHSAHQGLVHIESEGVGATKHLPLLHLPAGQIGL